MAAQQPPFLVVGDILTSIRHATYPEDWVKMKCQRREAYGCGENGKRIVDGLDLYARLGPDEGHPDFYPALRIGASRDVLNLVGCEIDQDLAEIYGRDIRDSACVHSLDGGVMVLRISFVAGHKSSDFKSYCLVYDSTAPGALSLLPERPHDCLPLCPSSPLKLGQGKLSVVLMVARSAPDSSTYPVLCLWSPPAATGVEGKHTLNDESDKCAWIEKGKLSGADAMNRQWRQDADDAIDSFTPSLVFSYKGNAVWGDLLQGILYCDCADLNVGPAPVDFKSNMLPLKCRAAYDMDQPPIPVYRNMGCVGDSIWFVIIKPSEEQDPGKTMVSVWTLDRLSEEEEWKPHREFKMQTIWDLDGFRADTRLPKTVPMYPIFRQQDEGILYMLLPEPYRGGAPFAYLLGIDLSSSCEQELRLLSPRRLVIPRIDRHPLLLDTGFFGLFGPPPCHLTV